MLMLGCIFQQLQHLLVVGGGIMLIVHIMYRVTNASIINHIRLEYFYEDSENTTYKNTSSTTGINKSYF